MYSRLDLGPVHFPSGVAHISDPASIDDSKHRERTLKEAVTTVAFAVVNGTPGQLANTQMSSLVGHKVPTTAGRAMLLVDGSGRPQALAVYFADDKRMANSHCHLKGFLSSKSGQVMVADLDQVIATYREDHVRSEDEESMPFGYDLVCLNSARNDKRGSAFRDMAVVAEFQQTSNTNKGLPVMTMIEENETVGIFISF